MKKGRRRGGRKDAGHWSRKNTAKRLTQGGRKERLLGEPQERKRKSSKNEEAR